MAQPQILVMGQIYWAQEQCKRLLEDVAEVICMQSKTRAELFDDLRTGGRYSNIVGVYHEHLSQEIVGMPDAEMIAALPESCKWFAHKGAGYDAVAVEACKARGIGVSNTPSAVDEATATTALYLLLATVRNFNWAERHLRQGGFSPIPAIEAASHDLYGLSIGILGLGGIGLRFVDMLQPLGMSVYYHNRRPAPQAPASVTYCQSLKYMLGKVDVLSVHMPLNAKTVGFIGEEELKSMKRGSIVINTARGKVIDEEALIRALQDGQIASVGLDVFATEPKIDQRLLDMPQCVLLPHVGTENQDARRKMETVALRNLREFVLTGSGPNLVAECR